jgi:hypothetical protein
MAYYNKSGVERTFAEWNAIMESTDRELYYESVDKDGGTLWVHGFFGGLESTPYKAGVTSSDPTIPSHVQYHGHLEKFSSAGATTTRCAAMKTLIEDDEPL